MILKTKNVMANYLIDKYQFYLAANVYTLISVQIHLENNCSLLYTLMITSSPKAWLLTSIFSWLTQFF